MLEERIKKFTKIGAVLRIAWKIKQHRKKYVNFKKHGKFFITERNKTCFRSLFVEHEININRSCSISHCSKLQYYFYNSSFILIESIKYACKIGERILCCIFNLKSTRKLKNAIKYEKKISCFALKLMNANNIKCKKSIKIQRKIL